MYAYIFIKYNITYEIKKKKKKKKKRLFQENLWTISH